MKKITLKESELVDLIEKLVKENLSNGVGQIFPLMGTPSAKYKELLEKDDVEETDEVEEDYEQEDHKDRDEFDGRKSRVVGVDSDIKKQRMGESKKKSLKLTESQLINIIERVIKERKK
tara:strand:+ start:1187 stop:1543 length:357 start_codon:yes stop_codon:yes gene_type:complete